MGDFFNAMFEEMGARRRRLRAAFGERGQGLVELLLLGGLMLGSVGLLARPWMAGAAPWGFALPFVFAAGYFVFEAHRQGAAKIERDEAAVATWKAGYDWSVFIWAMACAVLGVAAFVLAWGAAPTAAPVPDDWAPLEGAVSTTIVPGE